MQVSANGGYAPRWARGGAELYYYELTGTIVRVSLTSELSVGHSARVGQAAGPYQWGVTGDGERVLTLTVAPQDGRVVAARGDDFPIYVTVGWESAVRR